MFDDIKKEIDDALNHLNPFEEISTDTGSILPEHVKKFIADKKATQKEQEMIRVWKDEIAMNGGKAWEALTKTKGEK
tara:strand:+ start:72 stop:302 length:231 start_codon:yes stop_codon:yes gene_type:complete